jgi:hypothetical protein
MNSVVSKFKALNIPVGWGLLTVAGAHTASGDTTDGITSVWMNKSYWQGWADTFNLYWDTIRDKVDVWFHCQMEAAFISQALSINVTNAGYTKQQLKEAMSPYLDAIEAAGLTTIVRPFSSTYDDWGLGLVLEAGARGSVWILENFGSNGRLMRRSLSQWNSGFGAVREDWNKARVWRSSTKAANPFHYESGMRMYGTRIRDNWQKESDRKPIYEITYLSEQNGTVNLPKIGTDSWFQCTSMNPVNVLLQMPGYFTALPSCNDARQTWLIPVTKDDGQNIYGTNSPGTAYGTVSSSDFTSWQRSVNPTVDTTDNSKVDDPLDRGLVCSVSGTIARCFRISPQILNGAGPFTLKFTVQLPPAPASGTTYGICGQVQANASSWNIIYTSGGLYLNVRDSVGEQRWSIDASPPTGTNYIVNVGYDPSGSATGKWYAQTSSFTPNIVMNGGAAAILIGATHDILNRTTVVWGCPDLVLPRDTDVVFWTRCLTGSASVTGSEIKCIRAAENRMPIGMTRWF